MNNSAHFEILHTQYDFPNIKCSFYSNVIDKKLIGGNPLITIIGIQFALILIVN